MWGHLKLLVYSAPVENKQILKQGIFDVCETAPNLLNRRDSSWSDISVHVLVQVKDLRVFHSAFL
jgi:hypothetical protein